jgi:hypothetical protein
MYTPQRPHHRLGRDGDVADRGGRGADAGRGWRDGGGRSAPAAAATADLMRGPRPVPAAPNGPRRSP